MDPHHTKVTDRAPCTPSLNGGGELARRAGGGLAAGFDVFAELAELLVAALEEVLGLYALEVAEGLGEVLFEVMGGRVGVAVGAAQGFLDDRVDHAQLHEVLAGQLER